jgi:menaquinone-dependent protoporphyrinogen IX oxidase
MMRVLIPYGTTEGLTAKISEYVAEVIRGPQPRCRRGGPQGLQRP